MELHKIEIEARRLQYEIWHKRELLWPLGEPKTKEMFDPAVAARVLDLSYEYRDQLVALGNSNQSWLAAGTFDRSRRIISISGQFNYKVQRFTGGHEVGHCLLHPELGNSVVHRDRPIHDGCGPHRPTKEKEADYFAACFLAPKKLLIKSFQNRFGNIPLRLNETVAFHLKRESAHELFIAPHGSLDFAAAVACAQKFDAYSFPSLSDEYGMSTYAMAIRLKELELVHD